MLVTTGKVQILNLMSGKNEDLVAEIHIGTGSTAAALADTALVNQVLAATASVLVDAGNKTITFTAVFQSEGSSYREVGIFTTDDILMFRQVISATSFASGNDFVVTIVVSYS